ncbi:hypothetical protein LCGC14_1684450 [marine sediment metagenome]|uniref:Uncharacterized protein n=1 Tax=marine sediment metagenome TaxID=412755 RepID=A0A0F9IA62_9ZZZZ
MQFSKYFDRGPKVKTLDELYNIAIARGSIYHSIRGRIPARVMCNQQLWTLKKEILQGRLFTTVKR